MGEFFIIALVLKLELLVFLKFKMIDANGDGIITFEEFLETSNNNSSNFFVFVRNKYTGGHR